MIELYYEIEAFLAVGHSLGSLDDGPSDGGYLGGRGRGGRAGPGE